jgi:hypothetical protein
MKIRSRISFISLFFAAGVFAAPGDYVDYSGAIILGGTSQTLRVAVQNGGRTAITNLSTETENLCVNVTSAASCADAGSWQIQPGETLVLDSDELITVVADTTGHKFTAKRVTAGFAATVSGTANIDIGEVVAGDASAAKQDTGNASLASIDGKLPELGQAVADDSVPVVLTSAQITTLTPPAAITGFATLAEQETQTTALGDANTSLDNVESYTSRLLSGSVPTGGGAATSTTSFAVGGRYNATPLALTDGQEAGAQLAEDGSFLVTVVGGGTATLTEQEAQTTHLAEIEAATEVTEGHIGTLLTPLAPSTTAANTQAATVACQYSATPPTFTDGQTGVIQCTETGAIKLDGTLEATIEGFSTEAEQLEQTTALEAIQAAVEGTVAVTGPLTDAELRATPVPVSGTVTANAGTNLNTSALALESGGNLAAAVTAIGDVETALGPLASTLVVEGEGVAGTPAGGVVSIQGVGSGTPVPVSGTVTATGVAQGSTTSGQTGGLVQGAVTTSAPTYTTAQTSPLSLTTAGGLRVAANSGAFQSGAIASGAVASGAVASGAFASGALASGSVASGAVVDLGAQADSAAAGDTSTASLIALLKRNNQNLTTIDTSINTDPNYTGVVGSTVPANALLMGAQTGANIAAITQGDATVPIEISTATTTQLVALTSGQRVRITSLSVIAGGTGTFRFVYGTGTNCGTGTTNITGAFPLVANVGLTLGGGVGSVLVAPAGQAVCAVTSAAVTYDGHITYAKYAD